METLCTPKSIFLVTNCIPTSPSNSSKTHVPFSKKMSPLFPPKSYTTLKTHSLPNFKNPLSIPQTPPQFLSFLNPHLCFLSIGLSFPLSTFASETTLSTDQVPSRINLEQILVSIDDFFNKYPFFFAGVTFIWLFVIPVSKYFLSKFKYVSAIDAFKKLKDDPNAQLIDIRDRRSVRALASPSLKVFNKKVFKAVFNEGSEEGFVKKVLDNFDDPANTVVCILDNFDGDSFKVAELLVNNGFKEAYAISDGVRGDNGWLKIQEAGLIPPSVHMYTRKKIKESEQLEEKNGAVTNSKPQDSDQSPSIPISKQVDSNGHVNIFTDEPTTTVTNTASKSLSPYPKYPDMKPPSSPTPSKP